jgi:hypothetical protein
MTQKNSEQNPSPVFRLRAIEPKTPAFRWVAWGWQAGWQPRTQAKTAALPPYQPLPINILFTEGSLLRFSGRWVWGVCGVCRS